MGRRLHYIPGSYYVKDDRTGFPQRAEDTRKEWNGLRVDVKVWEARQPQDLVRGRKDQQNVPDARPLPPAQFVGPFYVQITANANPGATVIELESLAGLNVGDPIGIFVNQDGGDVWRATITAFPSADEIAFTPALQSGVFSGNLMVDYAPTFGVDS